MKKTTELPSHYSSIEELILYRWDKYTTTKDNNWFLIDYDGRQSRIDSEELKSLENKLIDQYFKAIDDRSFSNKIQKWSRIDWLRTKYSTCHFLLNELKMTIQLELDPQAKEYLKYLTERRYNIISELKKWNLKFPEINDIHSDLALINSYKIVLEGIKTEIGILSNELQQDGKKEHQSLIKQLQIATLGLGYGYRLNAKELTVVEWIEICKLLEEKAKNN